MGTNKWHNADFLAVMMVVVAVVEAAEVAIVVVVPAAAAVLVDLSLHSRVLTCLRICNPKVTRKNCMTVGQFNKSAYIYAHIIMLYIKNLCQMMSFITRKTNLNLPYSS
jgi:hypothetical protein